MNLNETKMPAYYLPIHLAKLKWAVSLLVIFLAGTFWYCSHSLPQKLPPAIKDTYVAVMPFKNNTGNRELDVIGEMAADWITYGLHETAEGKILSASEVNRFIEEAKMQKTTPDHSISQQAGVHYLIEGTYYEVKDSLLFSSHVKDLQSGEIVFSFPIQQGSPEDPMASIEQLKQRILGYWVTKGRAGYERRPPIYEAYQAYLDAGKVWYDHTDKATELLKKAIDLDSNFHYAAFGYIHKLISGPEKAKADSMITAYQNKKEQLNRMELEFLTGLQSRITKNYDQQWKNWNSPFMEAYWGKNFVLKQKTSLLLGYYNHSDQALDLLNEVDFASLNYKEDAPARMLYFNKIEALSQTGRTVEAAEMWTSMPFEIRNTHTIFKKIFGLAQMKSYSQLERAINQYTDVMSSQGFPPHYLNAYAIMGLWATDDLVKAEKETRTYLRFLEQENKDLRPGPGGVGLQEVQVTFYLALQEAEKAKPIMEKGIFQDGTKPDALALKGIYYAQMKNETAAREVIQQLKELDGKYDYGNTEMLMATIETWLGNHDTAISLLMEARRKGMTLWGYSFGGDWRLKPLLDHPDFKKKVLVSLPLPELGTPLPNDKAASNKYWPFVLILLLGSFTFYFFQRKAQRKEVINSTDIPHENNVVPADLENEFLIKLKTVIASNMNDSDFSLPQLCKAMGVSRAQIYRKIKDLTDQSPSVYIRSLKLQKAKELLHSTDLNISEIAYEVGFKDLSYFSRSYSEEFGEPPSETRK